LSAKSSDGFRADARSRIDLPLGGALRPPEFEVIPGGRIPILCLDVFPYRLQAGIGEVDLGEKTFGEGGIGLSHTVNDEIAGVDAEVDFTGIKALPPGDRHTWTGTLVVPATGHYMLAIQTLGARATV